MTNTETIRRRLDKLDQSGDVHVYFVDADERDKYRLPDGPEVQAEIDAIRAADPLAHVIKFTTVDGSCTREEAGVRVAALLAERLAEVEAP